MLSVPAPDLSERAIADVATIADSAAATASSTARRFLCPSMLYPPNSVIAPGSRRPFLKIFDRPAKSAVAVDFSSVFRRLRAPVPRTLQPYGTNFFRRFSLLDSDSGPPRPEARIRSRDDHPCPPAT